MPQNKRFAEIQKFPQTLPEYEFRVNLVSKYLSEHARYSS